MQAKLKSIGEEDINSNGKGVALSSVILYEVSEQLKETTKKDKHGKKSGIKEPKS